MKEVRLSPIAILRERGFVYHQFLLEQGSGVEAGEWACLSVGRRQRDGRWFIGREPMTADQAAFFERLVSE